jgi:hypothetical protein
VLPPDRDGAFVWGAPEVLMNLAGSRKRSAFGSDWDISGDDQRFLMVGLLEGEDRPGTTLTVVMNWFDELRSRVTGN